MPPLKKQHYDITPGNRFSHTLRSLQEGWQQRVVSLPLPMPWFITADGQLVARCTAVY